MAFSHILITRPREEGEELAELLSSHPAQVLTLPAYEFRVCEPFADQLTLFGECSANEARPLVVFTSPRAVEHGLNQLPGELLPGCRIAAIGPTTAKRLEDAGLRVEVQADQGHTSEDLLAVIPECAGDSSNRQCEAFILTAPGGRSALAEGLRKRGYNPHLLLVYERKPAELDPDKVEILTAASSVLSVWTSADSIHGLSQRLPGEIWKRLCAGEWVVISERLARVARSFHPQGVNVTSGPTNGDIAAAVRALD